MGRSNTARILVTGANGLCGESIRRLSKKYKGKFYFIGREFGDLTKEDKVIRLYKKVKPTYVIHTAAKVGGIGGNIAAHADYFYNNILMNTYMLHYAQKFEVRKFIAFSSICVFPDNLATLKEENLHDGPAFDSNFAYAYAKRMIDIQIEAQKRQYGGGQYCSVIPGNIYGPSDMYNLSCGHVIPSLIHKIFRAQKDDSSFVVWGDGRSIREFIYVDDLAKIVLDLITGDEELPKRIIVSNPQQTTIKEVVDELVLISGFKNKVVYDTAKPNGQRARPTDLSILNERFPNLEYTNLTDGLRQSYNYFANNYPNCRGVDDNT